MHILFSPLRPVCDQAFARHALRERESTARMLRRRFEQAERAERRLVKTAERARVSDKRGRR